MESIEFVIIISNLVMMMKLSYLTSFCQNSTSKSCTTDDINLASLNCSFRLQINMPSSSNVSRMAVKRSEISLQKKNNNKQLKVHGIWWNQILLHRTRLLAYVCRINVWLENKRAFCAIFRYRIQFVAIDAEFLVQLKPIVEMIDVLGDTTWKDNGTRIRWFRWTFQY